MIAGGRRILAVAGQTGLPWRSACRQSLLLRYNGTATSGDSGHELSPFWAYGMESR
jgi:hypothetical protein